MSITKSHFYHICYIYTDIVQNQLVEDMFAPLLRVVPEKDGKVTYVYYDRLLFLSINRSKISVVEVNIRDERSDLLSFQSGTSITTLPCHEKTNSFLLTVMYYSSPSYYQTGSVLSAFRGSVMQKVMD